MSERRFIDLFCGAGLFSAGFCRAGFEPLLSIDLDGDAIASYRRNVYDSAQVRSAKELSDIPKADLLLAGPPCQGFSTLGNQDPADVRNDLCMTIPRWAEKSHAKIVIVENVPPFIRSCSWKKMTNALIRKGFSVDVWFLNAAHYGTAQIRIRAFTVASKIGAIKLPMPLKGIVPAKAVFRNISSNDPMHVWPEPTALALERFKAIPPKGDKRDILKVNSKKCPPSWRKLGTQEATDVWGRIDPSKPANTLRCRFQNPSTGRYIHPTKHRVLSLREGARIQGVSDSWNFIGNRTAQARQIGNGVPVPLAYAVAKSVSESLGRAGS